MMNDLETPEKTFDITCSQTLSKDLSLSTSNYQYCTEEEYDKEGNSFIYSYSDTSDTDWKEVYKIKAMTPLDIINTCKNICATLYTRGIDIYGIDLKEVIANCENWIEDDYCVIEN